MKKLSALFTVFMIIFAAGIYAHAADFDVTAKALPNGEAYTPYTAQITTTAGNSDFVFEVINNSLPAGLVLDRGTGAITGTPTDSGWYKRVEIQITYEPDGTSKLFEFSILIKQRPVKVHVTAPQNAVYNGSGYTATAQCFDQSDKPLNEISPNLTYGTQRLTEAVNANSYNINISVPGCSIVELTGDTILNVYPAPVTSLTVTDKVVPYTGAAYDMEDKITVNPPDAGHSVTYRKRGTSEYVSAKPSAAGIYDVNVYTTNSNYETAYASATLTITAESVDFNLTGEEDGEINYGEEWHGTYTPSKSLAQAATVKYVKDNVEYDTPKAAPFTTIPGSLKLSISFTITVFTSASKSAPSAPFAVKLG